MRQNGCASPRRCRRAVSAAPTSPSPSHSHTLIPPRPEPPNPGTPHPPRDRPLRLPTNTDKSGRFVGDMRHAATTCVTAAQHGQTPSKPWRRPAPAKPWRRPSPAQTQEAQRRVDRRRPSRPLLIPPPPPHPLRLPPPAPPRRVPAARSAGAGHAAARVQPCSHTSEFANSCPRNTNRASRRTAVVDTVYVRLAMHLPAAAIRPRPCARQSIARLGLTVQTRRVNHRGNCSAGDAACDPASTAPFQPPLPAAAPPPRATPAPESRAPERNGHVQRVTCSARGRSCAGRHAPLLPRSPIRSSPPLCHA